MTGCSPSARCRTRRCSRCRRRGGHGGADECGDAPIDKPARPWLVVRHALCGKRFPSSRVVQPLTRSGAPMNLDGLIPATGLPIHADGGIDETGLRSYIRGVVEQGPVALAINVDTGEGPHLTHDEKVRVLEVVRETTDVPLVAGLAGPSTAAAVRQAHEFKAAGA